MIGGSVLRAARARWPGIHLRVWGRRVEALAELRAEKGLADLVTDSVGAAVDGADLVVLATPVRHMAGTLGMMEGAGLGPGCLVTDVGSVKLPVVRELAPLVAARGGRFIGSHPMAGSEKSGFENSSEDLFAGAAVILTPEPGPDGEGGLGLEGLRSFWEALGGRVAVMAAARHDELVGAISHLPHLVASALTRSVVGGEPEAGDYCGGGLRDTTRIAAGPESMWAEILGDNREALAGQLERFERELQRWRAALEARDEEALLALLAEARRLREAL